MDEIRDYEKKKYNKRNENNLGSACKNDGKFISSVNTIEPSANLVGTMKGDSHFSILLPRIKNYQLCYQFPSREELLC